MNLRFISSLLPAENWTLRKAAFFTAAILLGNTGAITASQAATPAELQAGEKIYQSKCGKCHGDQGQGNQDFYPDPLTGDSSIGELQGIIADTMPEANPDDCVGTEATLVAAYIHHRFYSEAARLRNRPARKTLQRLTGTQLRQSLSDLFAYFSGTQADPWKDRSSKFGFEASIYTGTGWKKEDRKIDRIDPVVDFDFGTKGPGQGVDGKSFHAHWGSGLRVPITGRYEIIVRSTTAFTMWFGHHEAQLIDNHVQSEGRTEFRKSLWLTAGRIYPLSVDLTQRKRKGETPPSSVSLSWIPPGGVEEIIPATQFRPGWNPAALLLTTKMPPDDRTYGFERGISVDKSWDESVTAAAIEFADYAYTQLWPGFVQRHKKSKRERSDLMREFLSTFVAVAHRDGTKASNAPEPDQTPETVKQALASSESEADVIKYAVLRTIKSPRFLYPMLDSDRNASQQIANRLLLTLRDSLPIENWIHDQVRKDAFKNEAHIRRTAERLIDDIRTRAKIREMFHHWLEISPTDDLRKSEKRFPKFDAAIVHDLRRSLDEFIDDIFWSETSDFRQLVQSDRTFTTERLAAFYGKAFTIDEKASNVIKIRKTPVSSLRRSQKDSSVHVGVLTHPLLMTHFAHHDVSSPIHRGVFLIRHVMGRTLRPPNSAFAPLSPDLHPDLTTRQRISLQTGPDSCQICHAKINPLGFALENYDAVGRFRKQERKLAIDASGHYLSRDDQRIEFNGARQMGDFIANSTDAHQAFVSKVFQYMTKQPIAAYGTDRLKVLTDQFRASNFNMRQLLIEIAVIAASDPLTQSSAGTS